MCFLFFYPFPEQAIKKRRLYCRFLKLVFEAFDCLCTTTISVKPT